MEGKPTNTLRPGSLGRVPGSNLLEETPVMEVLLLRQIGQESFLNTSRSQLGLAGRPTEERQRVRLELESGKCQKNKREEAPLFGTQKDHVTRE